jgi:hypothetical protein
LPGLKATASEWRKVALARTLRVGAKNFSPLRLQVTAMSLDNEQEDLKAKLKTKTAELDSKIDGILKMMSEAKKIVKLKMEKEAWKSFGIQDSK